MNQNILKIVLDLVSALLTKKTTAAPSTPARSTPAVPAAKDPIDWSDPKCRLSKYFTVKDALYLNSWKAYHIPTEGQKEAILSVIGAVDKALDKVSEKIGKPIQVNVHAFIRPEVSNCPGNPNDGQDYNKWIYWNLVWKGLTDAQKAEKRVPQSPHKTGNAIDFHIAGFQGRDGCAKIRAMLLDHLEEFNLRLENIDGGWIHLDNLPVKFSRFFKP